MTRTAWIVLAVVAAAALLWLVASMGFGRERPRASAPSMEDEPVADTELEQPPAESEPTPAEPSAAVPSPAAAQPTEPAAPVPPPAAKLPPPEKTGPADELAARFASERRDASAGSLEQAIEAAFKNADVPAALLHSVSCRTTVCRVETRWAPDRAIGFMSAFTRLLMIAPDSPAPRLFDPNLGISPVGEPDANGVRAVDVYLARLPPSEPAPL